MALEAIVTTLDGVPEQFRELYSERNGQFEFNGVSGLKTQADVDRVSEALRKEREDHGTVRRQLSAFGDATPDGVGGALEELLDLRIKVGESGDIDERAAKLSDQRLATAADRHARALKKIETERDTVIGERDGLLTDKNAATVLKVGRAALKHKDVGTADDADAYGDMLIQRLFTVGDDGKVVSREVEGLVPGLSPLEVFTRFKQEGEHRLLFGVTESGGARGADGKAIEGADNPFTIDKKTKRPTNLTKAAQIIRNDPERAKRLCVAAKAQSHFTSLFPPQS